MKHQLFVLVSFLSFLIPSVVTAQWRLADDKLEYVLIISSYSYADEWGTSIAKSINQEVEKQNSQLIVNISYAGIPERKTYLSGRFGMQSAFTSGLLLPPVVSEADERVIPKVLVLIGDEAWMYYRLMERNEAWSEVPVVLVGVHPSIMGDVSDFYTARRISEESLELLEESHNGICRRFSAITKGEDEANTIELMRQLLPSLQQIYFVSNNSYQDVYSLLILEEYLRLYPELKLTVVDVKNQNVILSDKSLANGKSAVLINSIELPEATFAPLFTLKDKPDNNNVLVGGYYSKGKDYAVQAADFVLKSFNNEASDYSSLVTVINKHPYLNKTVLAKFNMAKNASQIHDVVYTNVPLPFHVRHIRIILLSLLVLVILIIIIVFNIRDNRYKKSIAQSYVQYKKLNAEYQILYDNMPMALFIFDVSGNLKNSNAASGNLIKQLRLGKDDANLFQMDFLNDFIRQKVANKQNVNTTITYQEKCYRLFIRRILDEELNRESILMLVIDNTDIQREREAKERIFKLFNFAMNASALGVAEYNYLDNTGYATEAWYENLAIKNIGKEDIHRYIVDADREKINNFLEHIGEKDKNRFSDIVCVETEGGKHWLHYIIQLLEYAPEKGKIIVLELALNIDKQKSREQELADALVTIQESDRLKNAFIANMSNDIRPSLEELVSCSKQLTECDDEDEKQALITRIEHNNDILLEYIANIIDLSRGESEERAGI
ncbi:hypothetical protein [Bacteroides sp. 214]|uniref:hypothetical protein n=1 Tax=Bacteroides sp. 214 TaxID=2302935 RepID=UPI0013D00E39|nr:hypothetical protein [Bacteroides sp. 214]